MKNNASRTYSLRLLAAATAAMFVASCDKPGTPEARGENTPAPGYRDAGTKAARGTDSRVAGFHWNAGDTRSYTLELAYAIGNPAKDAAPDPAARGIAIRGNYHLAVLSTDGGKVTLAATVADARILRSGESCPILEELVNSTPAVLTLSRDGALQQIAFPAAVPLEDRDFLQAIYGWEFQVRAGLASWTAKESDSGTLTEYLATYTAGSDGSVIKTRGIAAAEGMDQEIRKSKFVATVGACWLDSLKGAEATFISSEGNPIGEALVTIALERSETMVLPESALRLLATMPLPGEFTPEPTDAALGRMSAFERINIGELQAKFSGVDYEVPFKALEKVADTGNHADCMTALKDFSDMLKVRPEFAVQVAESLKAGVSPHFSSLLAHALELANTEATQKTLADILTHPGDYSSTVLAQAIVATGGLGTLKVPAIAEALDVIQSSFNGNQDEYQLGDAALFSLSRLVEANPELGQPLVDVLTPLLTGGDQESRGTAVLALANAKLFNPELIGLAQDLLTSSEPQTRAAALSYFEAAPALGADQIQSVAGLLHDEIAPVQVQAVATLAAAYRQDGNPQSLAALQAVAGDGNASEDVREAARLAVETASATAGK